MPQPISYRLRHHAIGLALMALVTTALIGPASAGGKSVKHVASKTTDQTLGKILLTNTKHHTLYTLSVEKHGKFVCTGPCVSTWSPLVVPAGVKPVGPVKLGTVVRPSGNVQVTFHGRPLYTFSGDRISGQVNGEGIKDVGTWHAVTIGKAPPAASPPPEPAPAPQPAPVPEPQPQPQPAPPAPPFPY